MSKILIVAHDAGGAEVVSSWAIRQRTDQLSYLLEGPAVKVFERKCGGSILALGRTAILERINGFDQIVTGSGWASDLEKKAVQAARKSGVFVATYLDHWTNYRARFELDGALTLPNEIWVGDEHALRIARATFREHPIKLEPNRYFEDIVESIKREKAPPPPPPQGPSAGTRILYVTEPISIAAAKATGNPNAYGYTEFEALDRYLEYSSKKGERLECIRLRPHPAEPMDKYSTILDKYRDQLTITLSSGNTLVQDCAWASRIVGCDSMAMAIAVLAGKEVICCIPLHSAAPTLPFPEIRRLYV